MPRLTTGAVRRLPDRRGFTLVELLVAMVLLGLVSGTILTVVSRQQRFYRGANDIIDTRSQMRQAAEVLPSDMRGTSSIGGDITVATDSTVQFRANIGSSIVCAFPTGAGGTKVALPPLNLANHTLTAFTTTPARGDSVWVYDEGALKGSEDDAWRAYKVDTLTANTSSGYCAGGPYTDATKDPASKARYVVTVPAGTPLSTTIVTGAGVRFTRTTEYKLYQSSTDNLWYLGMRTYANGAWGSTQPLAGPFRAYANAGATGIRFSYYDEAGNTLSNTAADRAKIARVDVILRAQGTDLTNALAKNTQFSDSLAFRVAIRNRS